MAAEWLAWLPIALSDDPRGPARRRRHAVQLPPGQGARMGGGVGRRLEKGLVPIGRATTPAAEAEERRLLYVALTRAGVELHCSWARQRTFGVGRSPATPRPGWSWSGPHPATPRPGDAAPSGGSPRGGNGCGISGAARWSRCAGRPRAVDCRRAGRSLTPTWSHCEPGGRRRPGPPAFRPTWCCTTPPWQPWHRWPPRTTEELLAVPGLGPVKASRYGPTLLSLLSDRAAAG